ncbi:hypothetical protein [Deinococcus hopiensis]|uniref:Uncharacterized protein n=1 Tax=Deinococcus hopiensis KR-140 TaxID=695939 RepID=A0A1W1VUZ5_9DEIO|nr:hypothetical protein [Deinococcus hopiensis]SMB96921.1 hypothetical protein SAMN00790413_06212 [Deinococcus hopiensis KR-140]
MNKPAPAPLLLLTTALCASGPAGAAPATPVPQALLGQWFDGAQLPDAAYNTPSLASATSARFAFGKDGTYEFSKLVMTHIPGYAPMSTLLIACESLDVTAERGTFRVQGNKITLTPSSLKTIAGLSPASLNPGCKRFPGVTSTRQPGPSETDVWRVDGAKLTFGAGQDAAAFVRRTPDAAPTPGPSSLSVELRGEWHSGRISPVEYYNVSTGKWADASGTSIILKLNANLTYERTGLLVVTSYGCTSKLLVREKGKVAVNGAALTFTPAASSSTGYTCSPSKVSSARNTVKPYTERALVKVNPDGQHVLRLASGSGETLFNHPLGSFPERAAGRETATPPAPSTSGSPTASHRTPNSSAAPTPAPTRWTATGDWDLALTFGGQTYRATVSLDDDSPRILGSGTPPVEYVNGSSATGDLEIGLTGQDGNTLELSARGRFGGDRYEGQVRGKWGGAGKGTVTLKRR